MKANNSWSDWKFQLHWNNIEWVEPNINNCKKNILFTSTYKLYIKHGN